MTFCQKIFFSEKVVFRLYLKFYFIFFDIFFCLPPVKKYATHDFSLRIGKSSMSRPSKTNKCQILHTFPFLRIYFFNHNSVSFQFFLVFQKLTCRSHQDASRHIKFVKSSVGKFFKKKIIQKFCTGGSGFLGPLNIFSTKVSRNVFLIHSF